MPDVCYKYYNYNFTLEYTRLKGMRFCPNCGTPIEVPNAAFCPECGNKLIESEDSPTRLSSTDEQHGLSLQRSTDSTLITSQICDLSPKLRSHMPTVERGRTLEDVVADIFNRWEFYVEKRVRLPDRYGVEHEIDVLASKKEAFGPLTIAVECKYQSTPIGIKEIRNFNDKLLSLDIKRGIFVSIEGFTSDAKAHAKAIGIEIWDRMSLQDKIEHAAPESQMMHDVLPILPSIAQLFYPPNLQNAHLLQMEAQLIYYPYYFVDYHCFSQDKGGREIVNLESKGIVVISACDGTIHDSQAVIGVKPAISQGGGLVACSTIKPKNFPVANILPEGLVVSKIDLASVKIHEAEAKVIAQRELAKNIAISHSYRVGKSYRSRIIRPIKEDIDIIDIRLVRIPFFTAKFKYGEKEFYRTIQATTAKVCRDDLAMCTFCNIRGAMLLCQECGYAFCEKDGGVCSVCGIPLCKQHLIVKGLIIKKPYCRAHNL